MAYDTLARICILAEKYIQAAESAERAIAIDSTFNAARLNFGHAHLLIGDLKRAKTIYTEYISKETDPAAAKTTLLKDLDDLEAAGVTHPAVAKARAWLKE